MKTGSFSQEEIFKLRDALCDFVKEQNLDEDALTQICSSKSTGEFKGAWTKIASVLPDRSVQSCHNVCRRKFNCYNYKGKWSLAEEQHLLALVKVHQHEWKQIGDEMGRTPENVRDKWRELGKDKPD